MVMLAFNIKGSYLLLICQPCMYCLLEPNPRSRYNKYFYSQILLLTLF